MGGKGSGGARVGSGRKPKTVEAKIFHGTATLEQRRQAEADAPPLEQVDAPAGMPKAQLKVWKQLAPHALANRTLTAATAIAFRDLCEAIIIKRDLLRQIDAEGYTYKKCFYDDDGNLLSEEPKVHPLLSQHRQYMQRVEAGMTRFMLAPIGKEFGAGGEKPPADPFDEFDDDAARSTH